VTRSADLVITVSREAAADLPCPPRDLAVVSNYVDLEDLPSPSALRPPFRPLRLCFIGVLNSMFALRETLEAAARLPRDAVEIVLVGDGDERASLERLIRDRDLADRVQILGWRPRKEALDAVRQAHLGLLPLRDNGLTRSTVGNKMFEYMGLGRGVLSSGVGVMARIVREARAGIVVEPWSPPIVAEALRSLLSQPVTIEALGRAAREAVLSTYNWSREREALLRAYDRLEARRQGPALARNA
jgi:glycosyltransferase involved in cell wall biosynthesis